MNFLLSVAVALMLGASATPSNPEIVKFIEESQAEIEKAGVKGQSVAYEESFLGPAVVITQTLPGVPASMLSQIPTSQVKSEFVNQMKSDAEAKAFVDALIAEKTNVILRLLTEDGGNVDVIVTPSDLK